MRLAKSRTAGIIMTTTGVLFTNADNPAVGNMMRTKPAHGVCVRPNTALEIRVSAPVSFMVAATTNNAAMVTSALLENPVVRVLETARLQQAIHPTLKTWLGLARVGLVR